MELLNCTSCSLPNKIYLKARNICRKCYTKEYNERCIKKGCIECGNVAQLVKGRCHTCYERKRRNKLIEEAKVCPNKAETLRLMRRREYIKTKSTGFYNTLSRRVSSAINAYKSRDAQTDINEEWFINNIVDKYCIYCGISDTQAKEFTGQYLNVDKKVPSKGYKMENCVPACKACNTAKLDLWSYEEALIIGKVIKELREKRQTINNNEKLNFIKNIA
jgi:hypothetical protein